MYCRAGLPRGAKGALFGKTSRIGALCRFRRLLVLACRDGRGAFERRVRAGRTLQSSRFSPPRSTARKPWSRQAQALAEVNVHYRAALAQFATALGGRPDGPWRRPASIPKDRSRLRRSNRPHRVSQAGLHPQDLREILPELVKPTRPAAPDPRRLKKWRHAKLGLL